MYLTINAGLGKCTANLLEILKKRNVETTFFFIGDNLKKFSYSVK
ncbi:polysaccharide deacetylase family protein [Bacillus wiedmannii]|nr:polysaccharide deacetylase family protein [Bacillus wiedmannii]